MSILVCYRGKRWIVYVFWPRVRVPVHRWAEGRAEECRLFICSSVVRLEVVLWHARNTPPSASVAGSSHISDVIRHNKPSCMTIVVPEGLQGRFTDCCCSVSDPRGAAHQCVILWQQTFLNTEFLFCLATYVCHLSPLFRYACVRLDEWDTLIRKLSQQLSDKIMSICATGRASVGTCSCGAWPVYSWAWWNVVKALDRTVVSVKHLVQAVINTTSCPTLQVLLNLTFAGPCIITKF